MADIEFKRKLENIEDKLGTRYSRISKIFLIIGILLVLWAAIVFVGARVLNYGYNWAGLSVQDWIIIVAVILVVFIAIDLFMFFHFYSVKNRKKEVEKPKDEFIEGKKVHVFTFPIGMEGGIFSKTYFEVDDNNILRLRTLMIPPEELWGNK